MLTPETASYLADFGIDAVVGSVDCVGIFDEAYAEAFGIVSGSQPVLLIPDTVVAAEGDAVSLNSRNFVVRHVEPDGAGFARLILESA